MKPAQRAERFEILGFTVDPDASCVHTHFACSRFGKFTERASFPLPAGMLRGNAEDVGLYTLLAIALGVSYYKASAAKHIAFPPLTRAGRAMAEALYTEGLAEFFVRAELPFPPDISFSGKIIPAKETPPPAITPGPALVAFGGGKDSYVARAIIENAAERVTLASVTLSPAVEKVLSTTAPTPVIFLQRQLDPGLKAASAAGFNGHVPITAINMLMLTLYASYTDHTQVIFANERSADEPTMTLADGRTANHQYSKSGPFEDLIQRAIISTTPNAPLPYSLLRPFSELWIGRAFAQINEAFARFTSCNRNFCLAGDAAQRWCGACPKCAFTSLITAPFLSRDTAAIAFGQVLLDHAPLIPFYREICGLTDQKPWECVGTIAETQAALFRISQTAPWADSLVVQGLLPELTALSDAALYEAQWQAALTPAPSSLVPAQYLASANRIASCDT